MTEDDAIVVVLRETQMNAMQMLREEIRVGDEETRRFMRILHEEVPARMQFQGGAS